MIRLKSNVTPHPSWAMAVALQVAEGVYADLAGAELIVTSGMEGLHVSGSLHLSGKAVDLRIVHVPEARWDAIVEALRARLPNYRVVLERTPPPALVNTLQWAPHIHLAMPP